MRLILHAGTHKTGTSTIQRVLHANRDGLLAAGVAYPDPQRWFGGTSRAHHPFVHAVARQDDSLEAARSMLRDTAAELPEDGTVLLSAEPTYRHVLATADGGWWRRHRAFLAALADELSAFDVEVVLVLRRRDAFVESIYHERVAHGFGRPFTHLLDHADRLLDYDRQLDTFGEVFDRVRVLRYEDLSGPRLVDEFVRAVGLEVPPLPTGEWERRSTDARLSLWMAASYHEDADEELVTQRRRFSKNPVSDDLFEDFGHVTLWTDPADRAELLRAYGEDVVDDERPPARLTPEVEDRIDDAFDAYLEAKGLPPTGRRARRRADG